MHNQVDEQDSDTGSLIKADPKNINATTEGNTQGNNQLEADLKKRKYIKWGIIGAIILIVVILAIVLPITLSKKDNPTPTPIPPVAPGYNPYHVDEKDLVNVTYGFKGYIQADSYSPSSHSLALGKLLGNTTDPVKLGVNLNTISVGDVNNKFIKNLSFSMAMTKWRVAHFTLTDAANARYEIPELAVPKPQDDQSMKLDMLGFTKNLNPFYFSFTDPTDKDNVFITTKDQTLVVQDKYIQMDFTLPSQRIFGFGERVREFQLQEGTWTMWAIGQNSPYDDGTGRLGVYGVHPFVLVQGKNQNDFIGMFFRNSNFQSPILKYDEGKTTTTLSYITTGGIIDIYFFIHGTAKEIIQSYQNYFGTPRLPPFWSLGWQQASFKWTNQSMVQDVIDKYSSNGFPLDTVYLDIPYMDNFIDFTVDTKNFPNLTELATSLHTNNQHLVVIIDAGISAEDKTQKYYKQGNDDGVFIKSTISKSADYGDNLVSSVWPKKAVFVDWFNDKCKNLWAIGLTDLYNQTLFDGIWIDMNEPTTFIHGEIKFDPVTPSDKLRIDTKSMKQQRFLLQDDNSDIDDTNWFKSFNQKDITTQDTYHLPFIPRYNSTDGSNNFDNWTLSLNATSAGANTNQYNVHSLYGHMMSNRTHEFLVNNSTYANKDNRPFILTRSTFASTGRYASHWLGDNFRDWAYLRYSVAGIMNMNMFGVPHVGADICGFFGTKREDEMCARWIQLAQFYPLARFHYVDSSDANEPYLMNDTYKEIAKRAMFDRYSYLRHMYTCLFEAYKYGGSCFDPLFYSFPTDANVYTDIESTFIVGGAIKVTPILEALTVNQTTMEAYFPAGTWVNINDGTYFEGNKTVNLSTTGPLNVHMKPASILAFQNNSDNKITKTQDLFNQPISLYVNRDNNGYASGSIFLDQGLSITELDSSQYEYYQFHLQSGSLNSLLTEGSRGTQKHVLDKIRIFNASDLADFKACVLTINLTTVSLETSMYDTNTFDMINTASTPLRFHDIHSIHFASDLSETPCSMNDVNYKLADADMPDLTSNNASFTLTHDSLPNITVQLKLLSNEILNIKWTWADNANNGKRMAYEIPQELISSDLLGMSSLTLDKFVVVSNTPYFQVNVTTRSSTTAVFSITNLLYDEYYNFIKTRAYTSKGVFGLGERANKDFFFKDGTYSMWNRDSLTPDESGKLPGNNMYGTHPFFMYKQASSSWIGVFQKIANAQDWYIKNNSTAGIVDLTTITTGGVTDIYVMQSTTPDKVVGQYFTIVGNPVLVPQWALGWNQCRWGYKNLDQVKAVVAGYENYSIPLDVQWTDIDYLNGYKNFEYDKVNFLGLPDFVTALHAKNMKYVPIIDAGLAYRLDGSYDAFTQGAANNVFLTINDNKTIFIGQVWPNDAAYPDYFANNTVQWWQDNLDSLYKMIQFDGLWEDMNEASNFCQGVCYDKQKPTSPIKQNLKYIPTGRDLETKSISLDVQDANGNYQLDTHSLYGMQMVKATHGWFQKNTKRTFIIERSSFAGSGKFTSRWLGDNEAKWSHMAYSVSGIMLMNMFGIPLAGSDICGFIGDTTAELCTKWHLVGAFYPFSRNHNNWGQISQEPYVWVNSVVNGLNATNVMRDAVKIKYSLIRYYYSELFAISTTNDTATFYKPMFFEFPEDDKAYTDIIYNAMIGDSIKLSINPEIQGLATKDYYFPAGLWCAINGTGITVGTCFTSPAAGGTQTFQASDTDYQYHLREGKIIPLQDTHSMTFSTSVDLQAQPIDLHVLGNPDDTNATNWFASGVYINDDGVSLNYSTKYNKYLITASVTQTTNLSVKISNTTSAQGQTFSTVANCSAVNNNDFLSKIYFYNADAFNIKSEMTVKAYIYPDEVNLVDVGKAEYDATTKRLVFTASVGTETSICMSTIKELQFSFV